MQEVCIITRSFVHCTNDSSSSWPALSIFRSIQELYSHGYALRVAIISAYQNKILFYHRVKMFENSWSYLVPFDCNNEINKRDRNSMNNACFALWCAHKPLLCAQLCAHNCKSWEIVQQSTGFYFQIIMSPQCNAAQCIQSYRKISAQALETSSAYKLV